MMLEGFMQPWKPGQTVEEAKARIKAYSRMGFGLSYSFSTADARRHAQTLILLFPWPTWPRKINMPFGQKTNSIIVLMR
jgi:hypothetical protein